MGFWGKLGKVALKVAPYAAMAIPGVGIPLGMAISGGLSAASKKASGGSWKDALVSGGIGAGTSALGGKIPGLDKLTGTAAGKVAGKGLAPTMKTIAGKFATDTMNNTLSGLATNLTGDGARAARPEEQVAQASPIGPGPNYSGIMHGLGPVMGQRNQNNPNLAEAIGAGRQTAIKNQPFRQGYDITSYGTEKDPVTGQFPQIKTRTPSIFPTGRKKQQAGA